MKREAFTIRAKNLASAIRSGANPEVVIEEILISVHKDAIEEVAEHFNGLAKQAGLKEDGAMVDFYSTQARSIRSLKVIK